MESSPGGGFEINEFDVVDGLSEEAAAEAAEFFGRVRCEEARRRWSRDGGRQMDGGGDLRGGDFGGVDDVDRLGERGFNLATQERVVCAAEQESVRVERGFACLGEQLRKIDAQDFAGDGVVDPTFFDERDEQWAGFFDGVEAAFGAGGGVGVAFDGGGGGDDHDVSGVGVGFGGVGAGFNDAEYGNWGGGADVVEGERGGGVACDDKVLRALIEEEFCGGDGVAGDGLAGFCAVGEACGVAEVEEFGGGNVTKECLEDSESAEAGVEDADASRVREWLSHAVTIVDRKRCFAPSRCV